TFLPIILTFLIPLASLTEMNSLGIFAFLGLLAGIWARINVLRPPCDSPEVEEAALVAQEYLNAQHTHGYKYALNRIEDIKIHITPTGDSIYVLEIDLLETDCHVLDPTPVVNCTVRPKIFTAVEGDCDVVLKKVHGALAVTAFKCKTEESREDMCRGCHTLLPLNDTVALNFVSASLATLNKDVNKTYSILEVGRMLSQVGLSIICSDFFFNEMNVPHLQLLMLLQLQILLQLQNPLQLQILLQLLTLHSTQTDPYTSLLILCLSSVEIPVLMFKREVHGTPAADASPSKGPHSNKGLVSPVPLCPGRVRFFK
uniref:Cystatin fetuin-A-type domain-containing protein n=1 Tax=Monopterus albus TaxID=43700 RepID=A0A3Q3IVQ6_MONAL